MRSTQESHTTLCVGPIMRYENDTFQRDLQVRISNCSHAKRWCEKVLQNSFEEDNWHNLWNWGVYGICKTLSALLSQSHRSCSWDCCQLLFQFQPWQISQHLLLPHSLADALFRFFPINLTYDQNSWLPLPIYRWPFFLLFLLHKTNCWHYLVCLLSCLSTHPFGK